jgi:hypothetical protein
MFQVDGRTVRRWIEGTRPTPKVAIDRRWWIYARHSIVATRYVGPSKPGV